MAFSETREHARRKAQFWLGAAAGTLQVVILIIIDETEARHRAPTDGSETEVPDSDLGSDDDLWVGDLKMSVELWRGFDSRGDAYLEREIVSFCVSI